MTNFGDRLKKARKDRNMSLREVSEKTKIRPHILQALEENNFSILPSVYAKSFIKSYGQFLSIPNIEIQAVIDELYKPEETEAPTEPEAESKLQKVQKALSAIDKNIFAKKEKKSKPKGLNIVNIIIYSSLGVAISIILYFTFFSEDTKNPNVFVKDTQPVSDDTKDTTLIKSYFDKLTSKLVLEARAKDSVWYKIDVDGSETDQAVLLPGELKQWSAEEYFILQVDDAGAIELWRNGQKIPTLGPKGKIIRNIRITADTIINPLQNIARDSNETVKRRSYKRSRPKAKEVPIILEPSTIKRQMPFQSDEKEEKKPRFLKRSTEPQ